jgi:hypothetical protein
MKEWLLKDCGRFFDHEFMFIAIRSRLRPELTGAGDNLETIQVLDKRYANSASG